MKNKIVTHFYVKEEKKDNNGEAPIYLRITVNGVRQVYNQRQILMGGELFPYKEKVILPRFTSIPRALY